MTKTGKVATYGGINIPPVTIFMTGFLNGVNYYNEQKGTDVEVLGWDGTDGSFAGNFENLDDGKKLAQGFADEGADIIFPVAGPVGLGASALRQGSRRHPHHRCRRRHDGRATRRRPRSTSPRC